MFQSSHKQCAGTCLRDVPDAHSVNWTPTWTLRVCQMNCFADSSGNCPDASRLLRQPPCGHSPVLRERFPGNCSDTAWKLSGDCPHDSCGRCADANRLRSRLQTDFGLVMDWMRLWTSCRTFADIGSDAIGPLPGSWLNNTRQIARIVHLKMRGYFDGRYVGYPTGYCADIARTLRGHCAACSLTLV